MIAGLNYKNEIIAPMFYEDYTDSNVFESWLKEVLLPILKPKTIIILDNAIFHKGKRIEELVKSFGCVLKYLPTFSPDLNKIEPQWFVIKNKIRKKPVNLKNWKVRMCFGFNTTKLI